MDRGDGKFDSRHALEQFRDLATFPIQLGGVGQVLILTSAALAEKRAARSDPVRTRPDHFDEIGFRKTGAIAENTGFDPLSGKGVGNEYDPIIHSPYTFSKVS